MDLLKKLLLAVFVSVAMFATAPATMAAGKIEKATIADVTEAIKEAISLSEETLAALQSGAEKDKILGLYKSTKQASKKIESNIVDRLRSKANSRVKQSRSAYLKEDNAKAEELMTEAIKIFKEVQVKHREF